MQAFRERRMAAQDGLVLYARDYGEGAAARTPLLCLSGLTRNSTDFARLAARESQRRRVLCPDYRGRGRSQYDRDWRHYEPRVYLDDIAHLLAATGIGRVVVLGTSLGGLLAMGLAVMKPVAVAGVILNDVGPEVEAAGLDAILDYIARDRPLPNWASAMRLLRHTLPQLGLESDADWLAFARATYREGADGKLHFDWDIRLARALKRGPAPDLWPLFRALGRVPALALRGERSDILSARCFERMGEEKPDLVRVTVPGVGHAPSLHEKEAREAIDDFLERF
jgi:pimeloyl-ACP methyl ester carboxylesterase